MGVLENIDFQVEISKMRDETERPETSSFAKPLCESMVVLCFWLVMDDTLRWTLQRLMKNENRGTKMGEYSLLKTGWMCGTVTKKEKAEGEERFVKRLMKTGFMILCLVLILIAISGIVYAETTEEPERSGDFGEGLHWLIDAENNLIISGTGAMPDYPYSEWKDPPWWKWNLKSPASLFRTV